MQIFQSDPTLNNVVIARNISRLDIMKITIYSFLNQYIYYSYKGVLDATAILMFTNQVHDGTFIKSPGSQIRFIKESDIHRINRVHK